MVDDGYKKTDIGVIPEDWKVVSIDSISKYTKGFAFKSKDYKDTGAAIIRISDISGYEIDDRNLMYLDENKLDAHRKWSLKTNDLIVSTVGSKPPMYDSMVGKFIITKLKDNGSLLNQNAVFLRTNDVPLSRILLESSKTKRYVSYIEQILRGNANQANITIEGLLAFQIAIPSNKREQQAIATVLSDTDELINALEKLIAKKEAIKTGTMQELLTGKKRLDGFSGEWEEKTLGDIVDVVSGGTPSSAVASYWNGTVDWYTPTEIGKNKYVSSSVRKITKEGFQNCSAKTLPIGTILFTSRAGIGDTSVLTAVGCTNQGFQSLVVKKNIDNEFVYYLVSTLTNKFLQNASGSTFLEISPNKVKEIEIFIPQYQEQQAISAILSDMDSDIDALKSKLSKVKAIKKGMMQELLTGKTRLKV